MRTATQGGKGRGSGRIREGEGEGKVGWKYWGNRVVYVEGFGWWRGWGL